MWLVKLGLYGLGFSSKAFRGELSEQWMANSHSGRDRGCLPQDPGGRYGHVVSESPVALEPLAEPALAISCDLSVLIQQARMWPVILCRGSSGP